MISPTFKLTVSYNGRNYSGFQRQPDKATLQQILEQAIEKILGEKTSVVPSGRTDTGVHALHQVCHFNLKTPKALARISDAKTIYRLNCVLPDSIVVLDCAPKSGFHAQKNARSKIYEYVILISPSVNPFLETLVWRIPKLLRLASMKKAARLLVGKHDFSSFCAADSTAKTRVREILKIQFSQKSPAPFFSLPHEKFLRLEFHGRGFLKQMVRNIVGTLVEVGEGKRPPEDIAHILKARDRQHAGKTAPPQGLYLIHVDYETRSLSHKIPDRRRRHGRGVQRQTPRS